MGWRRRQRKDVAIGNRLDFSVGPPQHEATSRVDAIKPAYDLPLGEPYTNILADPIGTLEPIGSHQAKSFAAIPLLQSQHQCARKNAEDRRRSHQCARAREICRWIVGAVGMMGAIDSNPE